MELVDAITSRWSVRSFLDKRVPSSLVKNILETAVHAPSAGNLQPWQFIVLTDPKRIAAACHLNADALWGTKAPAGVVVLAALERYRMRDFWVQDVSAVTQNILLLAHAHGLGATWTGIYPEMDRVEGMRALLDIPNTAVPFSLVLMGFPKTPATPKTKSIDGRIHYNQYAKLTPTRYAHSHRKKKTSR